MRQGQQNPRRTRGRGRKVTGGLNRVYESNGPDVKLRGTASHIAERYLSLARDAQVAGDSIASENYMQHAEHYSRFIAAMQVQRQAMVGTDGDSEDEQPASDWDGEDSESRPLFGGDAGGSRERVRPSGGGGPRTQGFPPSRGGCDTSRRRNRPGD